MTNEERLQASKETLRCNLRHALFRSIPVIAQMGPGTGKSTEFCRIAFDLLRDLFENGTTLAMTRARPLLYYARTIEELADVRRTLRQWVEEAADQPEQAAWALPLRQDFERMVAAAPAHLDADQAEMRAKQMGAQPIHWVNDARTNTQTPIYPDACHQQALANQMILAGHAHISGHLCNTCGHAPDQIPSSGLPPCGTRSQMDVARHAPVVLATHNRLNAPKDTLREFVFVSDTGRTQTIQRAGFVDDFSEPLSSSQVVQFDQLDTAFFQLPRLIQQKRHELDDLMIRVESLTQSERETLDRTYAQYHALDLLQEHLYPALKAMGPLVMRRMCVLHRHGGSVYGGAEEVPMTLATRLVLRAALVEWETRVQAAPRSLSRYSGLDGFLKALRHDAVDSSLAEHRDPRYYEDVLPFNHLEPLCRAAFQGSIHGTWLTAGRQRILGLRLYTQNPRWQLALELGYFIADATPEATVCEWWVESGGHRILAHVPSHSGTRIDWSPDAHFSKRALEKFESARKNAVKRIVQVMAMAHAEASANTIQGETDAGVTGYEPDVQTPFEHSDRRPPVLPRPVSALCFKSMHPEADRCWNSERHQDGKVVRDGARMGYFGAGDGMGHRAHNQMAGHDLHLFGIPMLSVQEVCRQAIAVTRIFRRLGLDRPRITTLASYRAETVDDVPKKSGQKRRVGPVPVFADPFLRSLQLDFIERELSQAIGRARPMQNSVHITIHARPVPVNLERFDLVIGGLETVPIYAHESGADLAVYLDGAAGSPVDGRILAALATTDCWEKRDARGRKNPNTVDSGLPTYDAIKKKVQREFGKVISTDQVRETLERLARVLPPDIAGNPERIWEWIRRNTWNWMRETHEVPQWKQLLRWAKIQLESGARTLDQQLKQNGACTPTERERQWRRLKLWMAISQCCARILESPIPNST